MVNVGVAAAIADGATKQLAAADLSAARVLEELRRIAFSDITGFFNDAGQLKTFGDLTAEQRGMLASTETLVKNVAGGDGHTDTVLKMKVWDKLKALELLAKYFNILTEHLHLTAGDELVERLQRARKRLQPK